MIDDTFVKNTNEHTYQIHGHRNKSGAPTRVNERCFNLEGSVEFGGELRIVTLSRDGFEVVDEPLPETAQMFHSENSQLLQSLRDSPYIHETKLPDMISSFNFTPVAMRKGKRGTMTSRARRLFIQTLSQEIVIRSYDKFFNIGEKRQTEYEICATGSHFLSLPMSKKMVTSDRSAMIRSAMRSSSHQKARPKVHLPRTSVACSTRITKAKPPSSSRYSESKI